MKKSSLKLKGFAYFFVLNIFVEIRGSRTTWHSGKGADGLYGVVRFPAKMPRYESVP
jgi:hypothetical protein